MYRHGIPEKGLGRIVAAEAAIIQHRKRVDELGALDLNQRDIVASHRSSYTSFFLMKGIVLFRADGANGIHCVN